MRASCILQNRVICVVPSCSKVNLCTADHTALWLLRTMKAAGARWVEGAVQATWTEWIVLLTDLLKFGSDVATQSWNHLVDYGELGWVVHLDCGRYGCFSFWLLDHRWKWNHMNGFYDVLEVLVWCCVLENVHNMCLPFFPGQEDMTKSVAEEPADI